MRIIDPTDEHRELLSLCLEDWSEDARQSGSWRSRWLEEKASRGLRIKLAVDESGTVGGMIQYLPVEHSFVDGEGAYIIHCIWVHGYRQGRGNFQGRGMGSAMLESAEADVRAIGAKGLAAWGMWLPFWMKASWFRKHGYRKCDRQGLSVLVWKPFADDGRPPRWFRRTAKLPDPIPGKVVVTALVNGWCMALNLVAERARRASLEFGDAVEFRQIDTSERSVVAAWGLSDAVFVDHEKLRMGPPPSYEKIRKLVARRVGKLGGSLKGGSR